MMYTLKPSSHSGIIANYQKVEQAYGTEQLINFELSFARENEEEAKLPDMIFLNIFDMFVSRIRSGDDVSMLLSLEFINFLMTFRIPIYKTFQVRFFNPLFTSVSKDYLFVVFEGKLLEQIIIEQSTYKVVARSDKKTILEIIENIKDIASLKSMSKTYREEGKMLLAHGYKIEQDLDIWWGGSSFFYIHENVKQALEKSSLTGYQIWPFNKFDISQI